MEKGTTAGSTTEAGTEAKKESNTNISEVLYYIQTNLIVPKKRYNKFGGYYYRNAEDIVDEVKKLLPKGYSLILSDEIIMLGNRYYIKSIAELSSAWEQKTADGFARESDEKKGMDSAQITGAASSYARKYALNGLFAIDDGDDADSHNNTSKVSIVSHETNIDQKLNLAKEKASEIIIEYRKCTDLAQLADVQHKYHKELLAFDSRYPEIFKDINHVGLQMIEGFK